MVGILRVIRPLHPTLQRLLSACAHTFDAGPRDKIRAETGLLLERLGRSPGDLDYSLYCFQHP
jgi:hypothetical protein